MSTSESGSTASVGEQFLRNVLLALAGVFCGGAMGAAVASTRWHLPPGEMTNMYWVLVGAGAAAGAIGLSLTGRFNWAGTGVLFVFGAAAGGATMALAGWVGLWG